MVFQYFLGISFNLISPSSIFHFLRSEYSTVIWFSFWWQRWWRIRRGEGRMFESHLDQSTLNKTDPLYYDCLLYELTFLWVFDNLDSSEYVKQFLLSGSFSDKKIWHRKENIFYVKNNKYCIFSFFFLNATKQK